MDSELIKTAFNYGLPAALLILTIVGSYPICSRAGVFLAPIIKDVASKHMETMATFETVGKGLLQQSEAQTALMKSSGVKIDEIHEEVIAKKGKA